MPIYHRIEIARAHLHRAIVLFIEENDFINAITLAGAAEEVLGKFALQAKLKPAMEELMDSLHNKLGGSIDKKKIRNDYLNRAKNSLKHFDLRSEETVEIQPEEEAISMILRAVNNLFLVEGQLSEHAEIFYSYIQKNRPDLFEHLCEKKEDEDLRNHQQEQVPIAIVAYADILGYKNFIRKIIDNIGLISQFNNRLHKMTAGMHETFKAIALSTPLLSKISNTFKIRVVSDSVIFVLQVSGIKADTLSDRNKALALCLETFFTFMSNSCSRIIAETGCPLRGGISMGPHYESERENYLFMLSEAHNNAVSLEGKAIYPRMLMDNM